MTYVLPKAQVGICKSILKNLTITYSNCLESVTDWDNANNEPIYCCTKSEKQYVHFEYCCFYQNLLSQHRFWLTILLMFVIVTCAIFAFAFLLNLYMIVVAGSKADIPNITKLAFLPKPNFFPSKDKKKGRESSRTRSRSSTRSKRKSKLSSKEVARKKTSKGKKGSKIEQVDSKKIKSKVANSPNTSSSGSNSSPEPKQVANNSDKQTTTGRKSKLN